ADPAHRDERGGRRHRGRERARPRRRPPPRSPRGRLLPAHRREHRVTVATVTRRLHRLEWPALAGVLYREMINFSSYWRSPTFSSTVEPTSYLLRFVFRVWSLVSK